MVGHHVTETPYSYVTAVAIDKDILSDLSVGLEPFRILVSASNSFADINYDSFASDQAGSVVLTDQGSVDRAPPSVRSHIFNNDRVKTILFGQNPSSDQLVSAIRNKVFDYFIYPIPIPDTVNSVLSALSEIQSSQTPRSPLSQLESKSLHLILSKYDSLLYLINECTRLGISATASNLTTMVPFSLPTVHRIGIALRNDKMIEIHRSPTDKRVRLYRISEYGKNYLNTALKNKMYK